MSNEPTSTQSTALVSADLKKMLIVPGITLFVAIVVAWYAAQGSQSELRFQAQSNKETIAANTSAIKAQGEAMNQIVISIARLSENQTRLAADVRQLQDDIRAQMIQNRR